VLEGEYFKQTYRWLARSVVLHTLSRNQHVISQHQPYIAVHMRGPDDNTYYNFVDCHDTPTHYCTGKVLRKVMKRFPSVKILVISNNVSWTQGLLQSDRLEILTNSSAYDDFALLLGASAIVQHANHGWSSYSSNPAMMTGAPLITTYKRHLQHHRLDLMRNYGGTPDEFHDCTQIKQYLAKVDSVINTI
jgi:hypothetical protein